MPAASPPHSPAEAVQRPDAEHVVDLEFLLRPREAPHEDQPRRRPRSAAPRSGASRPSRRTRRPAPPARRCVRTRSLRPATSAATTPPTIAISELMATSPRNARQGSAHDITLKPNQPMHSSHVPSDQPGQRRGRIRPAMRGRTRPVRAPEPQHRGERQPAARSHAPRASRRNRAAAPRTSPRASPARRDYGSRRRPP